LKTLKKVWKVILKHLGMRSTAQKAQSKVRSDAMKLVWAKRKASRHPYHNTGE